MYIFDIKLDTKFLVQTFLMSDNVSIWYIPTVFNLRFQNLVPKLPLYEIQQLNPSALCFLSQMYSIDTNCPNY